MLSNYPTDTLKAVSRFKGAIVHLTHTDLDAVCSDAIVKRKHGEILTIYSSVQDYGRYLDHLAASSGRPLILYLSDLGGHPNVVNSLQALKLKKWHVEWRDHHIWDDETLKHVAQVIDYLRVDQQFCACEIVCQDLLPNDPIAHEIAAIGRDRDFWINEDPRSEKLSTVVHNDVWRHQVAEFLSKGIFSNQNIEREYEREIREKEKGIKRAVQRSRRIDHVAVTISDHYASDVAALLRKQHRSEIEVIIRTNGVFSIRSVAPISNRIAALFGGGGHPHAAGGNLHFSFIDRILFRLRTFQLEKVQKLINAAATFMEHKT